MADTDIAPRTNIVGFQNNNAWPLHFQISKLNMTLVIAVGAWVTDRAGRTVNDPELTAYARANMLTLVEGTEPAPLVSLSPHAATGDPGAVSSPIVRTNDPGAHAVRAATGFAKDPATGQTVAELIPTQSQVAPEISTNSVTAYTMERAKELGLARPTVDVPEDYGVTDGEGMPPSGAPDIKYARDKAPRNPKNIPPLPDALTQPDQPNTRPTMEAIQAAAVTPFAADGQNAAAAAIQTAMHSLEGSAGLTAAPTPTPAPHAALDPQNIPVVEAIPATAAPVESPDNMDSPASTVPVSGIPSLPEPMLEDEPTPVTIESVDGTPDVLPEPTIAMPPAPEVATPKTPVQTSKEKTIFCSDCERGFFYRSHLQQHAKRTHPTRVDEILAPYPEKK